MPLSVQSQSHLRRARLVLACVSIAANASVTVIPLCVALELIRVIAGFVVEVCSPFPSWHLLWSIT
jgi:hypothetical protein